MCMRPSAAPTDAQCVASGESIGAPSTRVTRLAGLPFSMLKNAPVRSAAGAGHSTPARARCAIRFR